MSTPAVGELCRNMWRLRESGSMPKVPSVLVGLLYEAIHQDMLRVADYDPEEDTRVQWIRSVLAAVRRGVRYPRASADLEATVSWLLYGWQGISGKDLAAGQKIESEEEES